LNRRLTDFVDTYTKDLTAEDLQRLFTRDTPDAYRFFTRAVDPRSLDGLPIHLQVWTRVRALFMAFTMKLSPARRLLYAIALLLAVVGMFNLFVGIDTFHIRTPLPFDIALPLPVIVFRQGASALIEAFILLNLLVLLEVADRLSLKNDLEVAREIQQAMLPRGLFCAPGLQTIGITRPANTVGGDFYDIIPLAGGRVAVAVGDVVGKGSPAALLMARLLAMMRTLVDEKLEPAELVTRLNVQVGRHAPGTRFITLLYAVFDPATGQLTYVNAGHLPPLLLRRSGACERLTDGGIALGMFEQSTYVTGTTIIDPDDVLAIYSDGITEAENPSGRPFDEGGLEAALVAHRHDELPSMGAAVVRAVEQHTADTRLADDLTILLLKRCTAPTPVGV